MSYWALAGPVLMWLGAGLLVWRVSDTLLNRGQRVVSTVTRPLAGGLSATVASALRRRRRRLAATSAIIAASGAFAVSTATFNATYRHQVGVDARLTNGSDVTVTAPPAAAIAGPMAARLARLPGVRRAEPLQHTFAYVGADLQDLYGVRPKTVVAATRLQDAYFSGASATSMMRRLAAEPDGVLVSAETVHDFQLSPGDRLRLRVRDARNGALKDVRFRYIGVVKEFPTAPRDSVLVANTAYLAARTGRPDSQVLLLDTGGSSPTAVAARARAVVGASATVTDIATGRRVAGSSLTAVDLSGLSRVELGFALVLSAAACGLLLGLDFAERRRGLAITRALGGRDRHVASFVRSEVAIVMTVGLLGAAAVGAVLAEMLVKVLTGVFDPPPAHLAVPAGYLTALAVAALAAAAVAAQSAVRLGRRPFAETLRDL